MLKVRKLSSERLSHLLRATQRENGSARGGPQVVSPPKPVFFPSTIIKQTNSAKNRNMLKAGHEGVPFLMCSGKDLSKEDELPFVF